LSAKERRLNKRDTGAEFECGLQFENRPFYRDGDGGKTVVVREEAAPDHSSGGSIVLRPGWIPPIWTGSARACERGAVSLQRRGLVLESVVWTGTCRVCARTRFPKPPRHQ
jgi:hypothetical protein